jgi:hypothetical protein
VAASAKLGKVIDLAWVPLPAPIGTGSVVVVAGDDGSLAMVDATQTLEQRSLKRRLAAFKNLVGGRWPFPQARAAPPAPFCCGHPPPSCNLLICSLWACSQSFSGSSHARVQTL